MGGNTIGAIFRLTTWGESHGEAVGAVIDGCPAGLELGPGDFETDMARRRPGQSQVTTRRTEPDKVLILSGTFEGKTTGAPISLMIKNLDVDSTPYEPLKEVFRPGHADYTYLAKYGLRDHRGGARSSARETAARVAAGVVAKKVLAPAGISILGYTTRLGGISASNFDPEEIEKNAVRCPDAKAALEMMAKIEELRKQGDSVGGVVEVVARGIPAGLGEPVFDKLDAELAKALMSIGSVKGVEFGAGFASSDMTGSQCNDQISAEGGKIVWLSDNAGGVLGGISSGQDIVVRIAVKPTSSISKPQKTVDVAGRQRRLELAGRHDPAICPRIVPVAEAMVAIVLADHLLRQRSSRLKPDFSGGGRH